jgi:hypothetical protein
VGAVTRAAPDLPWFTEELRQELLAAAVHGLKTEWVARYCGVAPKALEAILEMGARKGAAEPFRQFFMRWTKQRVELMKHHHERWVTIGDSLSYALLKELWPQVYGKDAKPDYDPFAKAVTHEEELAQLEAIIENPYAYGDDIGDLFKKHGRLRPDGT